MAPTTASRDESETLEPASSRVASFLDGIETKRRRTYRVRIVAATVGALIVTVAYLTSIGVMPPEAARLAASAGTVVAGIVVAHR
jgi:hypothetical protein